MTGQEHIHAGDWITIILVALVFLIAILRHFESSRFISFVQMPFRYNPAMNVASDINNRFVFSLILETIMFFSLTLFFQSLVYGHDGMNQLEFKTFVKIFLIAVLFISAQRFLHSLTGVLFNMKKNLDYLLATKDAHVRWGALILYIFLIFMTYTNISNYILINLGLIILATLYILGVVRGFASLTGTNQLRGYHIMFYLCTLEVLPILVIIKLLR